jgi:hypothetical protein
MCVRQCALVCLKKKRVRKKKVLVPARIHSSKGTKTGRIKKNDKKAERWLASECSQCVRACLS